MPNICQLFIPPFEKKNIIISFKPGHFDQKKNLPNLLYPKLRLHNRSLAIDYESTNKKNVTDAHKRFQCSVYYSIP